MSPWLIGVSVFFIYPLVQTAYFAFTHFDGSFHPRLRHSPASPSFVGFGNFRYLFSQDTVFWTSVWNSIYMIIFAVPIGVVFAFWLAHMLSRVKKGAGVFRTIFYLPTLAPPVAASIGFAYLFEPGHGPVNRMLGMFGIPPSSQPLWLQSESLSKITLIILGMWGVGSVMIIFLAAILDVPRDLYEAAELDGAKARHRLFYVTLPVTSPVILFAVITGVIDILQYFTQGYIVSGGSESLGQPGNSTMFYPIYLYQLGFQHNLMGVASAMAMMLFFFALLIVGVILLVSKRYVHIPGVK